MKRIGLLSIAFAAMLTVACGGNNNNEANTPAADTPAVGTAGEGAARDADKNDPGMMAKNWVEDRAMGNMTEIKLGELATTNAQNADVKAFGKMMVADHTKANDELKKVASKHNIQLATELDGDHQDKVNRLSKLKGAEFDREYINTMVDDHQNTLEALEDKVEKSGTDENPTYTAKQDNDVVDADLNQFAAMTAPTVNKHLMRAKQLNERLSKQRTTDR